MSEVISESVLAFMDAVTNTYGSDVWNGITSNEQFLSSEFASKVTQVDGVSAVYNNAGNVAYYKYNGQIVGSATNPGNIINSNVGNTVTSTSANIPANTTVVNNTVVAENGMKTVTGDLTAKTVVKDAALSVVAVMAGLRLGTTVDETLYNLNPDFWDENNLRDLDPNMWDTICSTETGKAIFNMVLGIDKDNDITQAFIDANTLAYMAKYMGVNGVFDLESKVIEYDPTTSYNLHFTGNVAWHYPIQLYNSNTIVSARTYFGVPTVSTVTISNYDKIVAYVNNTTNPVAYSVSVIGVNQTPSVYENFNGSTSQVNTRSYSNTIDGTTYNWCTFNLPCNTELPTGIPIDARNANNTLNDSYGDLIHLLYYNTGVIEGGGVDGMPPQTGATLPTGITENMSIADVLAVLASTYPDLYDDAIYNDVVQPDGSVTRTTYIPVPIPQNITVDDTTGNINPTGGTESGSTQANPAVNPTTTPEDVLDTLLKLITGDDAYNPTETPPETPTVYPDTGTGNTPAIITPTGSASALYTVYNPSQSELNSFGAWLWSSNFVDQLLKVFNDPMQAIIGLHKIFSTPTTSGSGSIKVGYLDSGVSANLVSNQYSYIDCGTINLYEYFGNVLDYTNTDIYMYLPFIGIVPLNVSDIMRSSINVKYSVDVLTGACLASVNIKRDNVGGQLYTYSGNCAVQYPLSSGSYMGIVTSVLGIAGSIAGTIASGGALLPLTIGAGASALNNARTNITHSGSISGNSGAMGVKKPYLIIRRPQTVIADNFEMFDGVSNNKTVILSSCTGFTRIKSVHFENILATSDELIEIETLLKDGVII